MHQIAGCLHGEWRRCCKPRDLSTTLHTYAQVICVRERHRQHIAAASPTLSNRRSRNRFPASSHFHFPTQPLNVSLSASASQSHKPSTSEVRHSHCIPFSCCLTFIPSSICQSWKCCTQPPPPTSRTSPSIRLSRTPAAGCVLLDVCASRSTERPSLTEDVSGSAKRNGEWRLHFVNNCTVFCTTVH